MIQPIDATGRPNMCMTDMEQELIATAADTFSAGPGSS